MTNPIEEPEPRYRGAVASYPTTTSTPNRDDLARGIVLTNLGSIKMNRGDWVAFTGATQNNWTKGRCMRWTGIAWESLAPLEYPDIYASALTELLRNAPDGEFNILLCNYLQAQDAFIENLGAYRIKLKQKTNPITQQQTAGIIQSEKWTGAGSNVGWMIDYDGNA
jgi:hypothetical protein